MKSILLIGLGRFGRHIAMKLDHLHHQVMAVDKEERRVNAVLPYVTNAQIGDATNEGFLLSLIHIFLIGSGIAAVVPSVADSLNNTGAHGFSELLYAYSSCGGNNGSAFAGFNANTVFLNLSLGLVMLFARFLPIIGTLAVAGNLAGKKKIAATAGTLSTTNAMFVFLLIFIVLLIGALSFFPALALGPLAEFFSQMM